MFGSPLPVKSLQSSGWVLFSLLLLLFLLLRTACWQMPACAARCSEVHGEVQSLVHDVGNMVPADAVLQLQQRAQQRVKHWLSSAWCWKCSHLSLLGLPWINFYSSNQCTFCCNASTWSHYWSPSQNLDRFSSLSSFPIVQVASQLYFAEYLIEECSQWVIFSKYFMQQKSTMSWRPKMILCWNFTLCAKNWPNIWANFKTFWWSLSVCKEGRWSPRSVI